MGGKTRLLTSDQHLAAYMVEFQICCRKYMPLPDFIPGFGHSQMATAWTPRVGPGDLVYPLFGWPSGGCVPLHLGLCSLAHMLGLGIRGAAYGIAVPPFSY